MRRLVNLVAAACSVAVLTLAVTGPSAAQAASSANPILNECTSGRLSHSYTLQQLQHALNIMPAYLKQYSSCVDVINQGILTVKHGKQTGPTGGGGSFLPTPVIIILVLLVLAAVTFGALAIRQRRGRPGGAGPPDDGTSGDSPA
ncbi:MAG: hypothetical protein ACXVUX_21675 [Solirubrobacteraceae bacterium]